MTIITELAVIIKVHLDVVWFLISIYSWLCTLRNLLMIQIELLQVTKNMQIGKLFVVKDMSRGNIHYLSGISHRNQCPRIRPTLLLCSFRHLVLSMCLSFVFINFKVTILIDVGVNLNYNLLLIWI